jgi:hypothetical protein
MGRAIAVWAGAGAIVGVLLFIIRMIVDQDRIGANVVPYAIAGAVVGAAVALIRNRRVPKA